MLSASLMFVQCPCTDVHNNILQENQRKEASTIDSHSTAYPILKKVCSPCHLFCHNIDRLAFIGPGILSNESKESIV